MTTGVIRALFVGETENDSDKVVKSLIFSFVNYTIYAGFLGLWAFFFSRGQNNFNIVEMAPKTPGALVGFSLIALSTGLIMAFYKTNNGHKLLYKPKITKRTPRQNVWRDFFSDHAKTYVIVTFEDGRRLYGWPYAYSDNSAEPSLFLTKAEWLVTDETGEQKRFATGVGGILITQTMKIASIEVMGTDDAE